MFLLANLAPVEISLALPLLPSLSSLLLFFNFLKLLVQIELYFLFIFPIDFL